MEDRFQQKNNNKPTVVEINRQQELRDNCNLLLMINDLDRVKLVVNEGIEYTRKKLREIGTIGILDWEFNEIIDYK